MITGGCVQSHAAKPGEDDLNLNWASSEVILARHCTFVPEEELCRDPAQAAAFVDLLDTARQTSTMPLFEEPEEFLEFVEQRGAYSAMHSSLLALLGPDSPLFTWTPVTLSEELREDIAAAFIV